ncbi:MAG: hypothetical protein V4598_16500 [Bdellovibrionota bacterium]
MSKSVLTSGICIQWPYSQYIAEEKKDIETRTYPLAKEYLNRSLLLIETPGKSQKFKSRAIALIEFTECFLYPSEDAFYTDFNSHLVDKTSEWRWDDKKPKWGWRVKIIKKFPPLILTKRVGIIYTKNIPIPAKYFN